MTPTYGVSLRYRAPGGAKHSAQVTTKNELRRNDRVPVRFLPKHPGDAIMAG